MFPPPAVYKIPNDVDIKETMKQYGRYKRKSLARLEVTEDEMRRRRDLYLNDETQKFERTQREGMLESLVRAPAYTTFSPCPHHDHHLGKRTSHTPFISFMMYHMHVQARGTISSATFLQNAQMLVKPEEPSLVAAESSGSTATVAGTFCIGLIGLVRLCVNVPHSTHTHTHTRHRTHGATSSGLHLPTSSCSNRHGPAQTCRHSCRRYGVTPSIRGIGVSTLVLTNSQ
jgi:hypothetical protein